MNNNNSDIYAALDLGTNNCRLLVAEQRQTGNQRTDKSSSDIKILDSFSRIVKLGEGVSDSGMLSDNAIKRTLDALKNCQRKMDKHNITAMRLIATEACRRAKNSDEFLNKVREEVGLDIDIITPKKEAELAMLGCCSLVNDGIKQVLAFDIGGGSTEIMWVDMKPHNDANAPFQFDINMRDLISIPYGVMNLSEKFGGNHHYTKIYFEDIVSRLQEPLIKFDKKHDINNIISENPANNQLISTSGTVTTLAAVHKKLPRYERSKIDGITLPTSDIMASSQFLLNLDADDRLAHPCIGSDRNDYILSGCAIFEAIARTWGMNNITIADRGVREGIIVSLIMEQYNDR